MKWKLGIKVYKKIEEITENKENCDSLKILREYFGADFLPAIVFRLKTNNNNTILFENFHGIRIVNLGELLTFMGIHGSNSYIDLYV